MPPLGSSRKRPCLHHAVAEASDFAPEAFTFVQQALGYSVRKFHPGRKRLPVGHHINGQQLCLGLREFALMRWGRLAGSVLRYWQVRSTLDIGRIVFAMIDAGMMKKTPNDSLDDFRNVYDFKTAFEAEYQIPPEPARPMQEHRP